MSNYYKRTLTTFGVFISVILVVGVTDTTLKNQAIERKNQIVIEQCASLGPDMFGRCKGNVLRNLSE